MPLSLRMPPKKEEMIKIYLSLQKKGAKIPINDVWIAASCMEVGGTLLTRDRHFKVVEQIETVLFATF
ncbi:MAG TPA: PIN domain-containing protein [bacterium]|nr:PIN domain-containing protein [bacterium]